LKVEPGTLAAKVAPSEAGARFWFPNPNEGWVGTVGWKLNCGFAPKCAVGPKLPNAGGKVDCVGCGCAVKPVKVVGVPKAGSCGVVPGLLKEKVDGVVKDIELSAICVADIDPNKLDVGATVGVEATNGVGWAVVIPNLNIVLLLFWLLTVVVAGEVFVSMDTGSPLFVLVIKLKVEGFERCEKLNPPGFLSGSVMVGLLDCDSNPKLLGVNSTPFFSSISCFFCVRGNGIEVETGVVIESPSVDGCTKGNLFSDKKLNKGLLASAGFVSLISCFFLRKR